MITKQCAVSDQTFILTDEDQQFYQKIGVPLPTLCPQERLRRRMTWANQRKLYKRKCDGTGKIIISNYSSEKPYKVYDVGYFWSNKWSQLATGRDFDWHRPFFEQYAELLMDAPRPALQRSPSYDENSDYTNYAGKNKNCYLIFDSDKNRDAYHSFSVNSCESVCDCYRTENCELCYECIDCTKCYDSKFLQNCNNCNESTFLKNCIGCNNCFGCVNLRNKQYYCMNKSCTKEEYEKKITSLELHKYSKLKDMRQHFAEYCKQFPVKYMEGVRNENVKGNYLSNCKNALECFDSRNLWDCKYVISAFDDAKDCMDCTQVGDQAELMYECTHAGYNFYNVKFYTHGLGKSSNLTYCFFTPFCENCFGCVGLHHQQFCIFNKQYTEEEYNKIVPKIIEHMKRTGEYGEFFPAYLSPFAYNESDAYEYFPLTKEEILEQGLQWKDVEETSKYFGEKITPSDDIKAVEPNIYNQILTCDVTGRSYKIQPAELEFYKKMSVPIPRVHPDVRYENRIALRCPRQLWQRQCAISGKDLWTAYSPDRPEKLLCEEEFLKVVD